MLCCWEFFSERPKDYRMACITLTEECFDEGPTKQAKPRIWILKSSSHLEVSPEKSLHAWTVPSQSIGGIIGKRISNFIWWHCLFSHWSWGQMCGGVLGNKAHADTMCSLESVGGENKGRSSGYCCLELFFCLFYLLEIIKDASVNSFQTENYEHSLEGISWNFFNSLSFIAVTVWSLRMHPRVFFPISLNVMFERKKKRHLGRWNSLLRTCRFFNNEVWSFILTNNAI